MAAEEEGGGPDVALEEDYGSVNVVRVRGTGRLGLLVSPARRVDDLDVGLKVDDVAATAPAERPEMDQEVAPGDVFIAINDVPLFSFPTDTCIRLLELSSRCQRRKLKIFRRGIVTEAETERGEPVGMRILDLLGYPPDIRQVGVPDGRLGLIVSPAQQRGRLPQDVAPHIPAGWLRVDRKLGGGLLPDEIESGDVIIRVNALPLDAFDFATSLRILQLASNRTLTLCKRPRTLEDMAAEGLAGASTSEGFGFGAAAGLPRTGVYRAAFQPIRQPMQQAPFSFISGVSRVGVPPVGSVRGWHLVGKKLELASLRPPRFPIPAPGPQQFGEAAA